MRLRNNIIYFQIEKTLILIITKGELKICYKHGIYMP